MENNMDMLTYVNFLKSTGFIVQSFDSYNGLSNTYDYSILGSELKNNVKKFLINYFVRRDANSVLVDTSILTKKEVLEASGHTNKFDDYFVDCKSCKKRIKIEKEEELSSCPFCKENDFTKKRNFNLLFETRIGSLEETSSLAYLRPETAQGIFSNFHLFSKQAKKKIPFSICQVGKAFRNEITPSNFTYRTLEFEQFEVEKFIDAENWQEEFDISEKKVDVFFRELGIPKNYLVKYKQKKDELAHYAKKTVDIEFKFPFGKEELLGMSYRGDYDLKKHEDSSKKNMKMTHNNKQVLPHVIETSFGIDRLILALLTSNYKKEKLEDDKERFVLKLNPKIAPITCSIFPLSSNLREKTIALFDNLNKEAIPYGINLNIDISSTSIGKKYRRNDEIGTPFCLTFDFDSLEDNSVTIRNRDTMKQERIPIAKVINYIFEFIKK